ncbi:hypothetical protein C8035_v002542 [Colletotrichum spinosum]|uniref:Uncharacterized protein n=1 Tax=Colletotrichum spinosum TaxID=1347390 RepID=A0A4R8Q8K1_9PEZI|nr:hypothetical protein C8035_v002542 [Colletotrichum spinosum]
MTAARTSLVGHPGPRRMDRTDDRNPEPWKLPPIYSATDAPLVPRARKKEG